MNMKIKAEIIQHTVLLLFFFIHYLQEFDNTYLQLEVKLPFTLATLFIFHFSFYFFFFFPPPFFPFFPFLSASSSPAAAFARFFPSGVLAYQVCRITQSLESQYVKSRELKEPSPW